MALKATIYKVNLSISDMDRGCYGEQALTVARHPSETEERLMMRLLAFALLRPVDEQNGTLDFAKSMWEPDEPDLWHKDLTGAVQHWIDTGLPDETRIKRVAARATRATVLTYAHSTSVWWNGLKNAVVRLSNLTVMHIPSEQSMAVAALAQRAMQVQVMVQDGTVWFNTDEGSVEITPEYLQIAR